MAATGPIKSPASGYSTALLSAAFVFLWGTSFVGARVGLPYADPFTFIAVRMVLASAVLVPIVLIMRAPWPATWREAAHIAVAGICMNVLALGGMFTAMKHGLPVALTALIGSLQPLLTGLLAGLFLGERVDRRQWAGLVLGLSGVALMLSEKVHTGGATAYTIGAALIGLTGMTSGTLYQKAFCSRMGLRSGTAIQFMAAAAMMTVAALLFEERHIVWNGAFVFSLFWVVFVISLGAMMILWALIRHGAASKVASLFYLTPPVTAVLGYLVFHETLGMMAVAGMAVAAFGVAMVTAGRSSLK